MQPFFFLVEKRLMTSIGLGALLVSVLLLQDPSTNFNAIVPLKLRVGA